VLLSAFYSVFLPYRIFTRNNELTAFLLFFKPLLILSMFFLLHVFCSLLWDFAVFKKNVGVSILLCFAALACLPVPALIETVWYMGGTVAAWSIPSLGYITIACLLIAFRLCVPINFISFQHISSTEKTTEEKAVVVQGVRKTDDPVISDTDPDLSNWSW
jgi:hypothetical protein